MAFKDPNTLLEFDGEKVHAGNLTPELQQRIIRRNPRAAVLFEAEEAPTKAKKAKKSSSKTENTPENEKAD